jgi:hypothetical protein
MSDILTRFRTKRETDKVPPAPKQRANKPPFAPVPLDEAAPYFVRSTARQEPWSWPCCSTWPGKRRIERFPYLTSCAPDTASPDGRSIEPWRG